MNAFEKFIQDLYGAVIREDRWQLYLEGLKNTVLIALTACLIGIFIGLIVGLLCKQTAFIATKNSHERRSGMSRQSVYKDARAGKTVSSVIAHLTPGSRLSF